MGMLRRRSKSRALDLKKASGDQKSTWSKLPQELVIEILQRLKSYQDFVCVTSTCAFWRSIGITNAHTFSGGYQFPWLMLAGGGEGGGGYCSNTSLRGFYNFLKKMTCYLELPEANGKKHCLSWHGWLVTVDSRLELNVVHPLSRVQIKLPDIIGSTQLDNHELHHRYNAVQKAVFSSSPLSDDYTICILVSGGTIYLWRKGDACWRKMGTAGLNITDTVFYRGRFYAIDFWGRIYAWDTQGTRIIQVVANLPKRYWKELKEYHVKRMFLVESGGSLLMVSQQEHKNMSLYFPCTETIYWFQVFEVMSLCKSNDTNWRQVSDMGGRTLFLGGSNSSFSINASDFPGCKQNCIYFTDNFAGFYGWGIYHLEDGRLENFFSTSPHLWVELTI